MLTSLSLQISIVWPLVQSMDLVLITRRWGGWPSIRVVRLMSGEPMRPDISAARSDCVPEGFWHRAFYSQELCQHASSMAGNHIYCHTDVWQTSCVKCMGYYIYYLLLKDIYLSPCEWIELFSRQKEMSSFMSEAAAVAFVTSSVAFVNGVVICKFWKSETLSSIVLFFPLLLYMYFFNWIF